MKENTTQLNGRGAGGSWGDTAAPPRFPDSETICHVHVPSPGIGVLFYEVCFAGSAFLNFEVIIGS